jgi:hypothetical protein
MPASSTTMRAGRASRCVAGGTPVFRRFVDGSTQAERVGGFSEPFLRLLSSRAYDPRGTGPAGDQLAYISSSMRRQGTWADGSGGEDLTERRGERVRLAGLAVFATEEPAVVAREARRLRAEPLRDGDPAAVRELALGLLANRGHDPRGGSAERTRSRARSRCRSRGSGTGAGRSGPRRPRQGGRTSRDPAWAPPRPRR